MISTTHTKDSPQPLAGRTSSTVQTIQLLRFIAAAMVLVAHVSFFINARVNQDVRVLGEVAQGVALFFVISGFIMAVTATPHTGEKGFVRYFEISRLIRIVPLYWAMNAAKLLGLIIVPGMIATSPTVSNVILSLFFIPAETADGRIEPFYGVGWSLNFEMAFYALFALALLWGKRPTYVVIPLLLVATAISFFKTEEWPTAAFLLSPILFNFVWGLLIGEWYLAKRQIPVAASIALIVSATIMVFVPLGIPDAILVTHIHVGAIVFGFVALEERIGHRIPNIFTFLGDASYSIYLTHPMFAVFTVVILHRLVPWMPSLLLFIITLVLSVVFAAATYVYFEK